MSACTLRGANAGGSASRWDRGRFACLAVLAILSAPACGDGSPAPQESGFVAAPGAHSHAASDTDDWVLFTTPSGLRLEIPPDWLVIEAPSVLRDAELELPRAEGDEVAPRATVHYFSEAGAGSIEDNLRRWCEEIRLAGGGDAFESAEIGHLEAPGIEITTLFVEGDHVAKSHPGLEGGKVREGFAILGAILETEAGPFYLKIVGPARSVAAERPRVERVLRSAVLGP